MTFLLLPCMPCLLLQRCAGMQFVFTAATTLSSCGAPAVSRCTLHSFHCCLSCLSANSSRAANSLNSPPLRSGRSFFMCRIDLTDEGHAHAKEAVAVIFRCCPCIAASAPAMPWACTSDAGAQLLIEQGLLTLADNLREPH